MLTAANESPIPVYITHESVASQHLTYPRFINVY